MAPERLTLDEHGAALFRGAALGVLGELEEVLAGVPADRAGTRLHGVTNLSNLLNSGSTVGRVAASRLGESCRPVRAILFDKARSTNWALGWHQDRTIAVAQRVDVPGFGAWTSKARLTHVEPPFDVIEAMLTLRVHLDAVPADNAPLLIAPGSHRLGRIPEAGISDMVARLGEVACLAARGDVWAYATPILHASARSAHAGGRRVLQVDYSAAALPGGLEWLGI